jgi:hypothetical protein
MAEREGDGFSRVITRSSPRLAAVGTNPGWFSGGWSRGVPVNQKKAESSAPPAAATDAMASFALA